MSHEGVWLHVRSFAFREGELPCSCLYQDCCSNYSSRNLAGQHNRKVSVVVSSSLLHHRPPTMGLVWYL